MSDRPRDDVTEEQLDEASEDSFPASDPPAYTDPIENKPKQDKSEPQGKDQEEES